VLGYLGLRAGEDEAKFDAYLKSLRRDGVPFASDEQGVGAGHNLSYRFIHLMELAVALAFRTQGILSRHIVGLLGTYRTILRPLYQQAWLERASGRGKPRLVTIEGVKETKNIKGMYLDLSLIYNEAGMVQFIEPNLLGPADAFNYFMAHHRQTYPRPPLPISQYAEDIVRLAETAPQFKRGRPA
jgi:hypothetical protein